jgi:hypothetical protein
MSPLWGSDHKLIKEFNPKTGSDAPDVILIGERHRINYNPENDRRLNDRIVEASNKDCVFLVEHPSDQDVDQKSHPQTKNWMPGKKIYGCMNPEAFKKVNEVYDFYAAIIQILQSSQKASETALQQHWKEEWGKKKLSLLSTARSEDEYQQALITLVSEMEDLRIKRINSSHLPHATSIVDQLSKHKNAPQIIVLIGKNHLYIPKKIAAQNFPDEFEAAIEHIHQYLKSSGKWCVILKPKKNVPLT